MGSGDVINESTGVIIIRTSGVHPSQTQLFGQNLKAFIETTIPAKPLQPEALLAYI